MGGSYAQANWRLLTYWETFTGYTPPVALHTLRGDVDDWLTVTKHNGERIDEVTYVGDIIKETQKYMAEEWTLPSQLPSVDEWVESGVWMRGKSGTGASTTITIEGRTKRTRRYKGVDAALKSNREIAAEVKTPMVERMRVMQKSEGAKVRPVVVGGNALYRKMDFLSELVENGLRGSRTSTLFTGAAGNEAIDNQWLAEVRNRDSLKVPLDQSSFDNNQSKSTILGVLLGMESYIMGHHDIPMEYKQVWDATWQSLTRICPLVDMDGETRAWENGIPSGWRWTALLDTVLNIVSFRTACRYSEEYYHTKVPVGRCTTQGDDVIFTTTSVEAVETLVATYQTLGYRVHPHKTYISKDRGEFLRRSYERGESRATPPPNVTVPKVPQPDNTHPSGTGRALVLPPGPVAPRAPAGRQPGSMRGTVLGRRRAGGDRGKARVGVRADAGHVRGGGVGDGGGADGRVPHCHLREGPAVDQTCNKEAAA